MAVKFFGQYLVEKGVVSRELLLKAIELQEAVNLSFGDFALSMRLMSKEEIARVNKVQRTEDQRFGDLAVKLGIITQEQLQQVLTKQKNSHLYIGEALVKVGALNAADLQRYLEEFKSDQAQYETGKISLPGGVPHAAICEMMADLTYKMLTRVARLSFRSEQCRLLKQPLKSDIAAAITFSGDINARYVFSVSSSVQARIAAAILEEEDITAEPKEVLDDTVMEFVNVVCGNIAAKAAQLGKSMEIDPPQLITGAIAPDDQNWQTTLHFPICMADEEPLQLIIFIK